MSPATVQSDFVEIVLSPAGVEMAGDGGYVQISDGHFVYRFTALKPVRVLTSEWRRVLSLKRFSGQPILEVAPAAPEPAASPAATAAAPAPGPAAGATHTISPAASHTDAPGTQEPHVLMGVH